MKKAISLSLVTLLIVLVFSGCKRVVKTGSDYGDTESYYYVDVEDEDEATEGSKETTGTKTKSKKKSTVTKDTTTPEQFKATNLSNLDIPQKLKNPNITLTSWYDPGTNDNTTAFYWAIQKYQELYGKNTIKLIVTANDADAYKAKLVAMMAGNEAPELMEMKTGWMPTFAIEKMCQPVDGLINYSKLHYQGLVDSTSWNGKHYVGCPNGMWSQMIWYNESLFKKYGVKTPMDYYRENTWTWDNFEKAAKEMTTGNITGFATDSLDLFLRTQKNGLVLKNPNGSMTINMKSPEVTAALQKTYDMIYTSKCWNPDLTCAKLNFKKGKVAMSSGVIGFIQNYCEGMNDTIACAPLPKPNASSSYYSAAYGIFWGIGNNCKNLDGAVAFLKILAAYEDTDFGNRTPLERVLTDEQLKMTRTSSENAGILVHLSLSSWDPYNFFKELTTEGTPVATVVDKYAPVVQKAIDQVNKN